MTNCPPNLAVLPCPGWGNRGTNIDRQKYRNRYIKYEYMNIYEGKLTEKSTETDTNKWNIYYSPNLAVLPCPGWGNRWTNTDR